MKDYLFAIFKKQTEIQLHLKDKEITKINNNHQQLLKRQTRTPYENGNVLYLLSHKAFTFYHNDDYEKFGIATQTKIEGDSAFMNRLSTYNTSAPDNYDVDTVFYIKDNSHIKD